MHPHAYTGIGYPPQLKDFSGPLCEDPLCYRAGPHFPREWGCRWSERARINPNGTVTEWFDEYGHKLEPARRRQYRQ